jgi:hypothetical protein
MLGGFERSQSRDPVTIGHKNKKRPKLFSLGRLGSPPPELPNHESDTRWGPKQCKHHFGNPEFEPVTSKLPPKL